ncbi:DUF6678 family protein [Corticimicrobacter populi]|uniref:DUF6678 family protein n=1 Tax=Corticimicrobacter populi TaxID=2175229 RepID=UPI0011815385|nr:hypothetical protein FMZ60_06010 [Alcaligenaceae bacterium SJ-26]
MHPRIRAFLDARGLVSVMNRTKWTELAEGLDRIGQNGPLASVRYLDPDVRSGKCHIDWPEFIRQGPEWYEWLDVHAIEEIHRGRLVPPALIDHEKAIEACLQAVGVPYSRVGQDFRVWGYVDSRQPPVYVSRSK